MVRTATIPSLYFSDDRPGANKPMRARNGVATVLSVVGEGEGSRPPETSAESPFEVLGVAQCRRADNC
jgi:hypothetical protein